MALRRRISDALKEATKAKDRASVATLRLVNAAVKDRDIAARSTPGQGETSDHDILDLLAKMVRQRQDAAGQFRAGGREDLAERELGEIEVIRRFMPHPLADDEVARAVDAAIAATGAGGLKDMGRVMATLKRDHPGRIDGATASALVKKKLG